MKTLKLFSLIACMILCGITANLFSQDVIILSNGNEIEAKIVKVGSSEIEYKKWSNQDGPTYTEQTNNIFMIKYQNGEKDIFHSINEEQKTPAQSNVIAETKPLIKPQNAVFGAWTMFRFRNESGIMLGGGLNLLPGWEATGISVRLGGKFPNRIYLFGELTTSSYYHYNVYHLYFY